MGYVGLAMLRMTLTEAVRNEDFDWLTSEFLAAIPEGLLHLRVNRSDAAMRVGHDNGVGREFK